jgi:catechol 2,3-dioxygenase-like lactoylglutathione lyase family enzyme
MVDHRNTWLAIFPIGASEPLHLPVRDLEQAFPFYIKYLGCTIVSRQDHLHKEIVLQRDQVTLGLTENGGNPEEHSCAISVSDIDVLYQELHALQLDLSEIRPDRQGNQTYRVFFLRAPDGLCFCFNQPA